MKTIGASLLWKAITAGEPRHRGRRERPGAFALRLACSSSSQELATRVATDKSCRPCNDFLMSPAFEGAVVERVYEQILGILQYVETEVQRGFSRSGHQRRRRRVNVAS